MIASVIIDSIFLIKVKTYKGFFHYIGLYPAGQKSVVIAAFVSVLFSISVMILAFLNASVKEAMIAPNTFFRGFVAKGLINRLGFSTGNFIQALLFGLVHLVLFLALTRANPFFLLISFLVPGAAGYFSGYINEKKGNGSIIPGWIAHALGNVISNSVLIFII